MNNFNKISKLNASSTNYFKKKEIESTLIFLNNIEIYSLRLINLNIYFIKKSNYYVRSIQNRILV